ncbi:MAG: DoxX family protein [Trueperaceae bacterium]
MNSFLWIAQGLLALAFLASGSMKLAQSEEKFAAQMVWAKDYPGIVIKAIGLAEVLAAFGLILPRLTGIMPFLVPMAALGLVLIMIGAATIHGLRGETPMVVSNLVLLGLASFVTYGRWA